MLDEGNPSFAGGRKFWLDACRSMAILMVLLSHGRHFLIPAWENAAGFRIGGFLGVELFFVLSGFLVGSIAWHGFKQDTPGESWIGSFLLRRWLRTLPNFYLFLGVNGLLIFLSIAPGQIGDLLPFMVFAQNLAWAGPPVFGEAWSLSVEEIFYFVFPVCLLLFGKLTSDKKKVFVAVTLMLILAPLFARMAAVVTFDPRWDDGIRKVVVYRLDALMIGVFAGWLVLEHDLLKKVRQAFVVLAAGVVLITAIGIFFFLEPTINESVFSRIWLFPLVSLGCTLTILCGLNWARAPVIFHAVVKHGARWSYALYLVHMPVFHLIVRFMGQTPDADELGAITRWVIFMAGSVFLAALIERRFERPILEWRDRNVPR